MFLIQYDSMFELMVDYIHLAMTDLVLAEKETQVNEQSQQASSAEVAS